MKVVHIIKATRISGAERHLLILLPALKARGVDVTLILLEAPLYPVDDMVAQLTDAGVPVIRIRINRHLDWGVVGRIRRALRELRPDVVHTHLIHADLYGTIAARLARVKTVISSRHNDDNFRRLLPLKLMNRVLWRMTSGGIAISGAIARFCVEVEGAPTKKIATVHYGMALREYDRREARRAALGQHDLPDDALLVGMVCRLIDQKGVSYGLRAFALVAPRHPTAHLLIAGDGARRNALEAEAKALGIAERVHFLGWQKETAPLLAALDVFLMPSLWEGFGLVMLEAMAQSVPIIGSAVSAIPEVVVSGETGLLVPPRDAQALAAALERLLSDTALRRHMGMMGQDRLETSFSVERMAANTAEVYERFTR
jgi:glycosyltransferase involved in cell wall biosynthesis